MRPYLQLLTLFCLFFFVMTGFVGATRDITVSPTNSTNNTAIIKELPSEQDLDTFIAGLNHTEYFTNTATLTATKQHPTWPHDVWADPEGNRYVSFYFKDNSTPAGYTSLYYDDCGRELKSVCRISFKLIEPYYGLNVTGNQTVPFIQNESLPMVNETASPANNTMAPAEKVPVATKQNVQAQANNNSLRIDNSGNHGTIVQQNAGNIINNFVIYVQNLFMGK